MTHDYYNKETTDEKLDRMHDLIKTIDNKVDNVDMKLTYTNGKVRRHEKILLVVGTALLVILIASGSSFIDFAKLLAGI